MAIFFQALALLIKYLPEVMDAISRGEHFFTVQIQLKKFDDAAAIAEESKDTSELEGLFNPKPTSGGTPPK